jgi:hypothetical protein
MAETEEFFGHAAAQAFRDARNDNDFCHASNLLQLDNFVD